MRAQFTKKRSLARKGLYFVAAALSGLVSAPQLSFGAQLHTTGFMGMPSLGWLEQLLGWVEELYILIGGDPATLDRSGSADARIRNLTDRINNGSVPTNLSAAQVARLIEDIHDLYGATFLSIEGISAQRNLELRKSLENLWVSLGLDLQDLWS